MVKDPYLVLWMDNVDQTIALVVSQTINAEVFSMNKNAVTHVSLNTRFLLTPMVVLAAAATLLVGLVGTASAAAPIGKDGTIHACYRVKGKPKGGLRVVPSAKKRCKRGERKVTWSVADSAGQAGAVGQTGAGAASGQTGQAGATGSSSGNEAALQSKIASLALKLEGLEGVLGGISHGDLQGVLGTVKGVDNSELLGAVKAVKGLTNSDLLDSVDAVKGLTNNDLLSSVDAVKGLTNGDLTGAVDAVTGLTNADLTEAVDSLPVIDELCTQSTELTKQVNAVGKGVSEISLGGLLPAGLTLKLPTLPPLSTSAC
jgi:hypothetical protein